MGASFGFVDVLRDTKAMMAKSSVATAKIFKCTYIFGGFFAAYQGTISLLIIMYLHLSYAYIGDILYHTYVIA